MNQNPLFTENLKPSFKFDGPCLIPEKDYPRLNRQTLRVFNLMVDGKWRTLDEISRITGDPLQSISARLRDLRKERFGAHAVDKRPRGERSRGLWEYRLIVRVKYVRQ